MQNDLLSEDEQLTLACGLLDKEEWAIRRLIETYGGRVKSLLKRKLGRILDDDEIESCLHSAAMKACSNVFDESRGTMGGWFYILAYRAAQDEVKGRRSVRAAMPLEADMHPVVEPKLPASVEDDEPADAVVQDILKAVQELGPKQRAIVEADLMAEDGEADAATLATKLGIPKQHVYSYREKARRSLLKRMQERGHSAESVTRRRR